MPVVRSKRGSPGGQRTQRKIKIKIVNIICIHAVVCGEKIVILGVGFE